MNTASKQSQPRILAESERFVVLGDKAPADNPSWLIVEKACQAVVVTGSGNPASQPCLDQLDAHLTAEALDEAMQLARLAIRPEPRAAQNPPLRRTSHTRVKRLCRAAGIPVNNIPRPVFAEACRLQAGGQDGYGRAFFMHPLALRSWQNMQRAAREEGIGLQVVSAYRSYEYQAALIGKKLASGRSLEDILSVNTLPGGSEHHTGMAIDLHCPEEEAAAPALSTDFEKTRAFRWLNANARQFGFFLSYPRGNASGIQYEPWHWCYHPHRPLQTAESESSLNRK